MKTVIQISMGVFFLLFVVGCRLDPISLPPNEESHFELKPQTIVLEDNVRNNVQSVEEDRITISGTNSQSSEIQVGSVLLSQPSDVAPVGFLRKVMAIEESGGQTTYMTEPANLPDAFESYTWNYRPSMKTNEIVRDAPELNLDTISTTYTFDLGDIGGAPLTMELTLQLAYQLELVTLIDYTFTDGIRSATIGFDQFKLNDLSITKTFFLNGEDTAGFESFNDLQNALQEDLLTIALNPIPVDPPTSLVWVQPVISLKGILGCMFEAQYSNQIRLYNTVPAKGLMHYDGMTQTTTIEKQLPDNFLMEVIVKMQGSISIETGIRMEVGLAPYTRNLFTVGVGLNNSLINTLSGEIMATFRSDETGIFSGNVEFRTDLKVAGDIFIDGDFFGFAPDEIDAQLNVFESIIPLVQEGVTVENCFSTFKGISTSVVCKGSDDIRLYFDALTTNEIYLGGGLYELSIKSNQDSIIFPDLYPFGTSQEEQIGSLPPGEYTVTYTYWEDLITETDCRRTTSITIPDCNSTTDNNCGQDGFVIIHEHPYCKYQDYLGREWTATNINYRLNGATSCYDETPINCEVYGGLYTYEEASSLCPQGWHIPSMSEWRALLEQGVADVTVEEDKIIIPGAYFFKDKSYWGIQNNTEPGFNVKPSGYQSPNDGYSHLGRFAYFWTSTEADDPLDANAMAVIFSDNSNNVIISPNLKTNKMSCRCIKDE